MKPDNFYFDNYIITSGENQFILKKRITIKDSPIPENIGKERSEVIGYYGTIQSVFTGLSNRLCMDHIGNLSIALGKIDKLKKMLNNLTHLSNE